MEVLVHVTLDLEEIVRLKLEDLDLSGLGPREESEYELVGVTVDHEPIEFGVVVEVERVEGAHTSRLSIAERIIDVLEEAEGISAETS